MTYACALLALSHLSLFRLESNELSSMCGCMTGRATTDQSIDQGRRHLKNSKSWWWKFCISIQSDNRLASSAVTRDDLCGSPFPSKEKTSASAL
mmetsp:Transcript_44507/g.87951  ORF Transcript_44507/g.87951 Transcript_44507/m.87951 type:complete len:94 (+) Transcript_44507:197-478(+)